jgi:hypothetical protein
MGGGSAATNRLRKHRTRDGRVQTLNFRGAPWNRYGSFVQEEDIEKIMDGGRSARLPGAFYCCGGASAAAGSNLRRR